MNKIVALLIGLGLIGTAGVCFVMYLNKINNWEVPTKPLYDHDNTLKEWQVRKPKGER